MPFIRSFRIKAFTLHAIISIFAIGTICGIALLQWFPHPLFIMDGTWSALLILAVVDISLGPLITSIICSNKKSVKELVFDLVLIASLQISALGFGLSQIYEQRIIGYVYVNNSFHFVSARAIPKHLEVDTLPTYNGRFYGMLLPSDFTALMPSIDAEKMMYNPEKYRPLNKEQIKKSIIPLGYIPKPFVTKYGKDAIYTLIAGKKRHGIAVLSENMEILDLTLAKKTIIPSDLFLTDDISANKPNNPN